MQLRAMFVLLAAMAACCAAHYDPGLVSPRLRYPAPFPETLQPVHQDDYPPDQQLPTVPYHLVWMRARRSLQPGAPQPQLPGGQPQNGGVDVSVTREHGVGTVVDAQGHSNVWRSDDGNTRVDAHGQWRRVYDGPAHGQRSHSAGITFSHRWR